MTSRAVVTKTDAVILTQGVNELVTTVSSLNQIGLSIDSTSSFAAPIASASTMTASKLLEFAKETIIYSFLGVRVTMGEMVSKKNNSKNNRDKRHPGYETLIRILPFQEVVYPEKQKIDEEAYQQMQSGSSSSNNSASVLSVTQAFASYRALKNELESQGVYCHRSGVRPSEYKSVVVLDAVFPKTYRRSSFGVKLTERQLQTR